MIRTAAGIALAGCIAALATPALAGMPVQMELTCPVGGEEFTHTGTGSYSTFGSRPDGKPYGSWIFPIPIPECPGNGLVMYREFEDHELKALSTLVLADDYRALREETTYYRAQWLADRLGDGDAGPPWLLMRAAWQADGDPARKARYQREFAERAEAFPLAPESLETLVLRYRVANAWRELGEFERAASALDSIPTDSLDVEIPPREAATRDEIDDAENRRYLLDAIEKMRPVIAQRNTEAEPLTMIPDTFAIHRCASLLEEDEGGAPAFCKAQERAEDIQEARERLRRQAD